ncbi:hypothetical protein [Bradyrhizobium amphicarpaeae]|uniref:Uncharacterized protein n=1 Tax=Bradyrhizobium amphicarpaeae TaxID=1404768 RepID=A0A2U8PZ84_9BRAD|nr:hypothetical protein [Bradyrhizobium amphicarpaeae]AWM02538.1 hypothetical protein CIT40_22555 [Bradyrhizobium amphicarpaeae]
MSLLGFDALGRWALGQLPSSSNFVLTAVQGSIGFAGPASAFGISQAVTTAGTLAAGISAGFRIAEPAGPPPFVCASNAAAFRSKQLSLNGAFLVTCAPANGTARVLASQGAVSILGPSARFSASLALEQGAFAWAGGDSMPGRDQEAWVRRPFETMTWQVQVTLPPPVWNAATGAAGAWTADVQPENAWIPASTDPEPWTTE